MRTVTTGLTLAAFALALAACGNKEEAAAPSAETAAAPAAATSTGNDPLPKRKPGLWEQSVNGSDGSAINIRVCLDEATDAKMSAFGEQTSKDMCSENTMKRNMDGSYEFASTCATPTGTVTSTGKATGDFNTAYSVDAATTTTPTAGGAPTTANVKMTAKWAGECPAGWVPGDIEMPGGMRVNMTQMNAAAAGQ
jgi:predicted small lipoprotein YifL